RSLIYLRLVSGRVFWSNVDFVVTDKVTTEIIKHLGGGSEETSMRTWLAEHFEKFEEAFFAVALARRRLMFEHLDAQFGKALYQLVGSFEECRDRLRMVPQIQDEPLTRSEVSEGFVEGRVWFADLGDP